MTDAPATAAYLATPAAVERRLYALGEELDAAVAEGQQAETDYLSAKTEFDLAYARAYMAATGSNAEQRKSAATLACEEKRWDLTRAEALVKAHKENARRIYTHVDIARSVSVIVRAGIGAA